MSNFEKLKDAKIDDMLNNYLDLENQINTIPVKLSESLNKIAEAISIIPVQIDEKLQERISVIEAVAQKLDEKVQQEAASLSDNLRTEGDQIRDHILKTLSATMSAEIGEGVKKINEAASRVDGIAIQQKSPIKLVLAIGILCVLASVAGGFWSSWYYNHSFVTASYKQKAAAERQVNAHIAARDAMIAALPRDMVKKMDKIYSDAGTAELKRINEGE